MNKQQILDRAYDNFTKAEYDKALQNYALLLKEFPNLKEAYNGAILSEMAMSGEGSAEALFEYYTILRKENADQADIIIEEILDTMDGTLENLAELLKEPLKERLAYEDGILYSDFKLLVEKEEDFKKVFENIMFSTRVIITEKEDFIDFLENLVDNNFRDMAMSYLESALAMYKNDSRLRALLKRLANNDET